MTDVTVLAVAVAKQGEQARVAQLLQSIAETGRNEPGNLHFRIHQRLDVAEEFLAVERWRSAEDLERHLAADHIASIGPILNDLLASPLRMTIYRDLSIPELGADS